MSKTMTHLRHTVALTSIATVFLTGCMVGPKYHQPAATLTAPPATYKESPTQFKDTEGWKVAQPQDAMLRGKWWEIYNDPELNALEEQLNINNQNIKQFFENFMEARTLIAQARSQLYPTLGTAPAYQRSKSSSNLGNSSIANVGQQSSVGTLPLTASWEPDLWGKIRNTIREAQYNAQLSQADLENERLTEQATLAVTFYEIHGQDALQKILDTTVEADKKALALTQSLYDTGVGDQISVVEARTTLQTAQSQAINLGVARAQFEHAIAVLVGANASSFSIPVRPLSINPPPIPVGLPTQLLERRPDIAAAERNMAAANAEIGIAYAAFYPDLTLSAEGGFESSTFKHLVDWPSRFWSIGPTVNETIFDAGLRRATVNQFVATYNADLASYRQTVLTAFQQVEDNLASVRILSQQILRQQEAVASSQEFVTLETARYETGIDPYVDVVTAQTTLLSNQQSLASLYTTQMTASVQLIEALGGGWDRTQLSTPSQVSQKLTKADTTIQK
ncbi:efflux transporter outer membrane subunit [Granulicella sp. L60]|jgi:NodT family efflux transporter outer membrane factor (OMF) lipoprotein|uniref:efflux transporter outer membrane subunit n=1 Tax=Granulicella sp. L60 TaxID=1641866 RepID=UPI0020B145A9|nr:efflux transporter outer membrane subunit [Granulicella sp. L60]